MIRRRRPDADPGKIQVDLGNGEMAHVPEDAMQAIAGALMPQLIKHGSVTLTIGEPRAPSPPERPKELIIGSGRRGNPRKLGVMVSVRMDPELLYAADRIATAQGLPGVSTWVRQIVTKAVDEAEKPVDPPGYRIVGWACPHMNMTSGGLGMAIGRVSTGCGCEMQPIYEPVRAAA